MAAAVCVLRGKRPRVGSRSRRPVALLVAPGEWRQASPSPSLAFAHRAPSCVHPPSNSLQGAEKRGRCNPRPSAGPSAVQFAAALVWGAGRGSPASTPKRLACHSPKLRSVRLNMRALTCCQRSSISSPSASQDDRPRAFNILVHPLPPKCYRLAIISCSDPRP